MVIAIGVLLALVCLMVAAIPFLKYRHGRQTVDPLEVIAGLNAQRQRLYKELLTLEENAKAGAVPEPESNAVSQTLRRRAAENLWVQRLWEDRVVELDLAVERLISRQKAGITPPQTGAAPGLEAPPTLCPECSAQVSAHATLCPKCGMQMENVQPAP